MLIVGGNQSAGGYEVDNSLRFDDGSSDYLNRTPASAGNRKTWTWSGWLKMGVGSNGRIFSSGTSGTEKTEIAIAGITNTAGLNVRLRNDSGDGNKSVTLSALQRDPSAWYHIVVAIDTTQATDTNRIKIYINGELQTDFSSASYPSQNVDTYINSTNQHNVGALYDGSTGSYYDGYLAECVLIDGQQLDPTSFGEFDSDSGIWKPIDVSGLTFGTNGFYLPFENSAALGQDDSGNGNNFTVNNLTSIDQTTDTPTNNYATFNPLDKVQSSATYSEGNLKWTTTSGYFWNRSTIGVSSGKWYFEAKLTSAPQNAHVGIVDEAPDDNTDSIEGGTYNWGYKNSTGQLWNNGAGSSYGSTYTTGDIIGVYLDLDNNKLYFAKNGTIQDSGTGISITASGSTDTGNYFFAVGDNASATNGTWEGNFGNPTFSISSSNSDPNGYGNFEYSPNDGGSASFDSTAKDFYALNTKNLAEYG